jgi:hypothetical protein
MWGFALISSIGAGRDGGMVDAPVSKTGGREAVRVRVPLSVPQLKRRAVVAEW